MELNNTTNLAHQLEIWQTNSLTPEYLPSDRHLLLKYRKLIQKIWEMNVTETTIDTPMPKGDGILKSMTKFN